MLDMFPVNAKGFDAPLCAHIGNYGSVPLAVGIEKTYHAFRELLAQGKLSPDTIV